MLARHVVVALLLLAPGASALLALAAPAWAQQPGADEDVVVAIVDGVAVHRSELEATAHGLPEQFRQMPMQVLFGILLDRVIDFRLLANEAERLDLGADPEVGITLARARADVLRDALVREKIDEGTTEARLHERYDQLKQAGNFAQPEVHARHILLKSEDEAKAVIQELQGGADFATLAEARSSGPSAENGGDLGFFRREQMVPEFAEAAFSLEPGQVTPTPVQTQFGWHVIKVFDRRTTEPSFEESEPQLRQEVAREIVTSLVGTLREGAEIERFNIDGTPMQIEPEAPAGAQPEPGTQPEAQPEPEPKPE